MFSRIIRRQLPRCQPLLRARAIAIVAACIGALTPVVMMEPASAQDAPKLELPNPDAEETPAPRLPDADESVGERLDRSDGVIRPPEGAAPDMRVPPKDPGAGSTMPVIPPPGTPGGNPDVRPK